MTPPPSAEPTDGPDPDEGPGYADAVAELEVILDELEQSDVDIDLLVTRVRRAAELLAVCRRRIDDARVEVELVVAGLVTPPPGDSDQDVADDGTDRTGDDHRVDDGNGEVP